MASGILALRAKASVALTSVGTMKAESEPRPHTERLRQVVALAEDAKKTSEGLYRASS